MGLRISLILFALTFAACGKPGDEGSDGSSQAALIEPVSIQAPIQDPPPQPQAQVAQPAAQRDSQDTLQTNVPQTVTTSQPVVRDTTPVQAVDPILVEEPEEPIIIAQSSPQPGALRPLTQEPKAEEILAEQPIEHPPLPKPRPVIATESKAKPTPSPTESLSELEKELLHQINAARAKRGVPPVKFSRLQSSGSNSCIGSEGHSRHMAQTRRMSHDQFPADICMRSSRASAENVGYATGDAIRALRAVHKLMMDEGPGGGHYDNIMNSTYNAVGLGFFYTQDRTLWVTENFLRL